jgi:hypothetical protein
MVVASPRHKRLTIGPLAVREDHPAFLGHIQALPQTPVVALLKVLRGVFRRGRDRAYLLLLEQLRLGTVQGRDAVVGRRNPTSLVDADAFPGYPCVDGVLLALQVPGAFPLISCKVFVQESLNR